MLKIKKRNLSFFEGALFGVLIISCFLAWQYGYGFRLIKEGNYVWPSNIFGMSMLFVVCYVIILFVMYEFIVDRNAVQSLLYTIFGYYYLDSIAQIYYKVRIMDNPLFIVYYLMFNADYICFGFLLFALMYFHRGSFNKLLKTIFIDCTFHFHTKRIIFLFIICAPLWYYTIMPLFTPASIFLPLGIYILVKKKIKF
jgi:hypothetical protein